MLAEAYGTSNPEEIAKLTSAREASLIVEECDFDLRMSLEYLRFGIMGEWAYSSKGIYLRRFTPGERTAYEGALNNLPLVSAKGVSWDQVIDFRKDPEAVRKYRDLRLWLREGLNAQTVEHATDIIGQKIENYRWAIKKHGFQTTIGAITQLFDWKESRLTLGAAGVAGMFGGPVWAAIASGLTVVAQIGTWLSERKLAKDEILRGPDREIAILFEAQERFSG
jgi:hypothetical protein